jgi:hypothetical protein
MPCQQDVSVWGVILGPSELRWDFVTLLFLFFLVASQQLLLPEVIPPFMLLLAIHHHSCIPKLLCTYFTYSLLVSCYVFQGIRKTLLSGVAWPQ